MNEKNGGPKIFELPQNFGYWNDDMKQVPFWGLKNIRCYSKKNFHLGLVRSGKNISTFEPYYYLHLPL